MSIRTEHFHNTPRETYDRLVAIFGEEQSAERPDTKWVEFGAGPVKIVFFPERVKTTAETVLREAVTA